MLEAGAGTILSPVISKPGITIRPEEYSMFRKLILTKTRTNITMMNQWPEKEIIILLATEWSYFENANANKTSFEQLRTYN